VVGQRVEVEEVTHVDVRLTEWILHVGFVAVGRRVYLHNVITNVKQLQLNKHTHSEKWPLKRSVCACFSR